MSLGIPEIILIVLVIVLLFGGKRIPELARALGRASYEYKNAKELIKKEANELKEELSEKPTEYQLKDNTQNPEV
jgi:sec-independent protein translocase protein TatA